MKDNLLYKKFIDKILIFIFSLYLLLWLISGSLRPVFLKLPSFLTYTISIIFIFLVFFRNYNKKHYPKLVIPVVFLLFISSVLYLFGYSSIEYYLRSFYYLLVVAHLYVYISRQTTPSQKKAIIMILMLDFVFIFINTYFELVDNPSAARLASTGDPRYLAMISSVNLTFLGTYVYFYGILGIYVANLYLAVFQKKNRMVHSLIALSILIITVVASYTISILVIVFSILIIFLLKAIKQSTSKRSNILAPVAYMLILLILIVYSHNILEFFSNAEWLSSDVRVRLSELASFIIGNPLDGSELNVRLMLVYDGFLAFIRSSFLGNSIVYSGIVLHQHTTISDLLGEFGVFSLLYFVFIVNYAKDINYLLKRNDSYFGIIWISTYLILAFVNPTLLGSIFIYWFIFSPLLLLVSSDGVVSNILKPNNVNINNTTVQK